MKTPHGIEHGLNLTAEQNENMDALMEIAQEEFVKDPTVSLGFETLKKAQKPETLHATFAAFLNPKLIELARRMGVGLGLPLYIHISRTLASKWIEGDTEDRMPPRPEQSGAEFAKEVETKLPAQSSYGDFLDALPDNPDNITKVLQAPDQRAAAASVAFAAPYGQQTKDFLESPLGDNIRSKLEDDSIIPASNKPVVKGAAHPDRSKPVLSVAVLRGFEELAGMIRLSHNLRGHPDVRRALDFMGRHVDLAKKAGKIK